MSKPLEPNSPLHHQVRIVNPAKGHEHMRGWEGRVAGLDPSAPIRKNRPARWLVRFVGGSAGFDQSELEVID